MYPNPRRTRRSTTFLFFYSCPWCSWMNLYAVIVLLPLFLFLSSCASLTPLPPQPHMAFDELVYDFGVAGPGDRISHIFKFTNIGSEPLQITRVSTSCGCTAALLSQKEILPGSSGEIRATFETKRFEGEQETTITVHSNDPDDPKIELTIIGTIKRDVAVVPQGINFGDVKKGGTVTSSVRLLQLSQNELVLHRIEVNEKYLNATTSRFREENSRGIHIDITLKPEAPVGAFNEVITLHTNLKRRPRIDVPVWANILGRIQVQPDRLSLGTIAKGEKISQSLTVSSHDGKRFHVLKITCDLPFIHLQSSVDKKNKVVKISGMIDRVSPAGRLSGRIDIYTDDPDQRVIHVPVYGVIER
jgi:hypothetical protein